MSSTSACFSAADMSKKIGDFVLFQVVKVSHTLHYVEKKVPRSSCDPIEARSMILKNFNLSQWVRDRTIEIATPGVSRPDIPDRRAVASSPSDPFRRLLRNDVNHFEVLNLKVLCTDFARSALFFVLRSRIIRRVVHEQHTDIGSLWHVCPRLNFLEQSLISCNPIFDQTYCDVRNVNLRPLPLQSICCN